MEILRFKDSDCKEIISLFHETVHAINSQDYSQAQLDAWAPKEERDTKSEIWQDSLNQNITYVAKMNDKIVGFSDLDISVTPRGHLERLYVHKDYQGKGIATALVDMLEFEARKLNLLLIDTEASITARPFFESQGYKVVCQQSIERRGVTLINFQMVKSII